eukprot:766290-Hanusia_phi.AAC.2
MVELLVEEDGTLEVDAEGVLARSRALALPDLETRRDRKPRVRPRVPARHIAMRIEVDPHPPPLSLPLLELQPSVLGVVLVRILPAPLLPPLVPRGLVRTLRLLLPPRLERGVLCPQRLERCLPAGLRQPAGGGELVACQVPQLPPRRLMPFNRMQQTQRVHDPEAPALPSRPRVVPDRLRGQLRLRAPALGDAAHAVEARRLAGGGAHHPQGHEVLGRGHGLPDVHLDAT